MVWRLKSSRKMFIKMSRIFVIITLLLGVVAASCPTQSESGTESWEFDIGSHCYQYTETSNPQVSFDVGSSDCRNRGGNLMTIKDNTTQEAIVRKLKYLSSSHTVLLGLRKYKQSGWKWVTGESLTYSNWEKDSACADCECAKMKLELGGVWEKTSCAVSDWYTVYVCEYGNGQPSRRQSVLLTLSMAITVMLSIVLQRS